MDGTEQVPGRNTPQGFACRTIKNLEYIRDAYKGDAKAGGVTNPRVHVVTQIVNSMLGLIVYPHEHSIGIDAGALRKKMKDTQLNQPGWPAWTITIGNPSPNLHELVKRLRDGISHRNIMFDPENGTNPENITITIWNTCRCGTRTWETQIKGDKASEFCISFFDWLRG